MLSKWGLRDVFFFCFTEGKRTSILVQKGLVLAGLENGFVVHYLSDVLLGDHQLRTQLDATFGCVLVVDQFVHVAVLDEAEVLFRLLVLEEVDPGGRGNLER